MADNEVENVYEPEAVRNFDVTGAVDRLDRTLYELCTSESALTNDFNEYDQKRYLTNWGEINTYINAIQGQDRLDLPHSFPAMYHFRYLSKDTGVDWEAVKNTFVRDLARLCANAMVQLSRSESADQSNKFIPADKTRWDLIYSRGVDMVEQYAKLALPGDKPESADFELAKRGA
jgi:hypothetical protein